MVVIQVLVEIIITDPALIEESARPVAQLPPPTLNENQDLKTLDYDSASPENAGAEVEDPEQSSETSTFDFDDHLETFARLPHNKLLVAVSIGK